MVDELIGKDIGGYEVLRLIGQGGMARVYLARQQSMNRQVALKVLPRQFLDDETYLQRFNREVRIVSQLEHRNILPVHGYGEFEGQPYIVMRYMPSGSLDDLLRDGPMSLEACADLLSQIAPALDYAHSKDVLHRDLKPSNILRDETGGYYLTDFGIAKLGNSGGGNTITTQGVVGTPSYMSPEQAQGKPIDGRSDIYALGVMLFEMTTGRRPFEAETPYGVAVKQVTLPPPKPRNLNPQIPPAVEAVILRALDKDPARRYPSATALCEAFIQAMQPQAQPTISATPAPMPASEHVPTISTPSSAVYQQPYAAPYLAPSTPVPPYAYPSSVALPPTPRAQERPNPWNGVLFGGAVGCFFLLIAALAALIAATLVLSTEGGAPEPDDSSAPETLPNVGIAARATATTTLIPAPTLLLASVTPSPTRAAWPASLSDVSGKIVYHAVGPGGGNDIWLYDLDAGSARRLTDGPRDNMYPVPSPDGRWIAFQSNRDGDFEIFVMDTDGGDLRQLTNNNFTDRVPQWTPDSQAIIYSADAKRDGLHDLYRVSLSGGEPELVYSSEERKTHARFSPDGRHIVFTTSREPNNWRTWEIGRLDLETGEFVYLTQNETRDASPVYSQDGSTILHLSLRNGSNGVALMNADGSKQRMLYNTRADEWAASYSPDERFIVFTSGDSNNYQLWLMTADGRDAIQLTLNGGSYGWWLP
ncbi:MAG: protein kinase [Anaerolineae bacterium]|nr:protein kinase [Anaerolineae bacterium]MDW8172645.1 protein kinase [Anaerolineae bacterium]